MNPYLEFVFQSKQKLLSSPKETLQETILSNIQEALEVFDIDRTAIFPMSKVKIDANDLITVTRYSHKRLPVEYYKSLEIDKFLTSLNKRRGWYFYDEKTIAKSELKWLASLGKEGVKQYGNIPIVCFEEVYAGVSIAYFKHVEISQEYLDSLTLLAQVWVMLWQKSKLLASLNTINCCYIQEHAMLEQLTPRQYETLRLIGAGLSTREIASALNLSTRTIETYKYRIAERLSLEKGTDLTKFVLRNNIL